MDVVFCIALGLSVAETLLIFHKKKEKENAEWQAEQDRVKEL